VAEIDKSNGLVPAAEEGFVQIRCLEAALRRYNRIYELLPIFENPYFNITASKQALYRTGVPTFL